MRMKMCFYMDGQMVTQTDGHKVSMVFIYLLGDLTTDRDQTLSLVCSETSLSHISVNKNDWTERC